MVNPAVQLASKIPDKNLQIWAVSLLAGELSMHAQPIHCGWVLVWAVIDVRVCNPFF